MAFGEVHMSFKRKFIFIYVSNSYKNCVISVSV